MTEQQTPPRQEDLPRIGGVLRVRLTEDEYQFLKAFAESHGTTMSALIHFFIRAMHDLDQEGKTSTEPSAAMGKP